MFRGERASDKNGLIDKDDITATTNYGVAQYGPGFERGVTRREDRDFFQRGPEYRKSAERDIEKAGRERKALVSQMMSAPKPKLGPLYSDKEAGPALVSNRDYYRKHKDK